MAEPFCVLLGRLPSIGFRRYIGGMLWRNSRGRPLNAPAAFIHPCRPRRRKCISAYSYSLLRLVSAKLVLRMPIRLSAERQPFDIIALPKKYRNIFEFIPIAYGVVAVVMIARASLAPSKMLNTTLKKQFLDIARTADPSRNNQQILVAKIGPSPGYSDPPQRPAKPRGHALSKKRVSAARLGVQTC